MIVLGCVCVCACIYLYGCMCVCLCVCFHIYDAEPVCRVHKYLLNHYNIHIHVHLIRVDHVL